MSSAAVKRTSTGKLRRRPALLDEAADPAERLAARGAGDGVLHLVEPDEAGAGEHPVALVDVGDPARGGQRLGQAGDPLRAAPADPAQRAEGVVLQEQVVPPLGRRGPGAPAARSVRLFDLVSAQPGVRHPEELEVVVAVDVGVEVGEDVVDPQRLLDHATG